VRARPALGSLVAVATLAAIAAVACAGDEKPPTRLIDGTPAARPSRVTLAGIATDQVATRVNVVDARRVAPTTRAAQCLRRARDHAAVGPVVSRVGVSGESVTFRSSSGHSLIACDRAEAVNEGRDVWCGIAVGRLEHGRLQDPRLDLAGCRTAAADPVAFAWVEPGRRGTQYLAVGQPGFTEVYRVASSLPVRVATTSGIDQEGSRASFQITEHDRDGRLLRAYTLDARVAG
jgi:hypothetical protein